MEFDELWSFVGNKFNKVWIWLAMNHDTREIVGVYLGDRSVKGALGLWHSLPEVYRKLGMAYTDFWEAYAAVFPKNQLRQCGKETGQTSHIEHFNNTLRQRVGHLVRKTLAFSKKMENHIGAIWLFIHYYNANCVKCNSSL